MAGHKKSFSTKKAIKFGWNTTLNNLPFLIVVTIIVGFIQIAPNLLEPYLRNQRALQNIVNVSLYVAGLGVTLGAIKIYLSFVEDKIPQLSDLFSLFDVKMLWRYFAASALYGLVVLLGFLMLIIPGIYIATKYVFYIYFIVDKEAGVFESFSKSGEITKDRIWELFLFEALLFVIGLLGILAFGVGLFVALPVVGIAIAYVYRRLSANSKSI